jgi:hypothetical protein
MQHTALDCCLCSLALPHFFSLSYKQHDFWKKIIERKICVLSFSTSGGWNISHSKNNSVRYYHKCTYISLHVKYLLFLSDFNETWIFLTEFQKVLKCQISWKSVCWGSCCFRQTDVMKIVVALHSSYMFRNMFWYPLFWTLAILWQE